MGATCPKCGATGLAVARNMRSTARCKCGCVFDDAYGARTVRLDGLKATLAAMQVRENAATCSPVIVAGMAADALHNIAALEAENARLREECEQRERAQRSAAEWLESKSHELMSGLDQQLATELGMLALSVGQRPLPREVRERMAEDRDAALKGGRDGESL